MIRHTSRRGDELHSLITGGMAEGTRSRGRSRNEVHQPNDEGCEESLATDSGIRRTTGDHGEGVRCEYICYKQIVELKKKKEKGKIVRLYPGHPVDTNIIE